MRTYLDYNATTPILPEVEEAMKPFWRDECGNSGSSGHAFGQVAEKAVSIARERIADAVRGRPEEIIFTSGATESNNIAILGLAAHPKNQDKKHIISTAVEHKAILEPLKHLATKGYEVELVPVDRGCRIKTEDILQRLRDDTLLVSVMHANNETGVLQPISELCDALSDHPVYVHTDAAQGFCKELKALEHKRLDLISISGHKIFGPKGVGALVRRRRKNGWPPIAPLMFGGGQERGIRPGTLPIPLIVGFGEAAKQAVIRNADWTESTTAIRSEIISTFKGIDYQINGDNEHALSHVLNVSFGSVDADALLVLLKHQGIAISRGSACSTQSYEPSHVLMAMGFDEERTRAAVRISWGPHIKTDNWLASLVDIIRKLQA